MQPIAPFVKPGVSTPVLYTRIVPTDGKERTGSGVGTETEAMPGERTINLPGLNNNQSSITEKLEK